MEKASAAEIKQHKEFAERLKLYATQCENHALNLGGFEREDSASKPWIGYRKAATVIRNCTRSLKSRDDISKLNNVGKVIADLYVEFRDKGTLFGY